MEILLYIFLVAIFSAMATLGGNWGEYKRSYKRLSEYTFYRNYYKNSSILYNHNNYKAPKDEFIYFMPNHSFILNNNVHLHNSLVTYFDPYSLYWYLKYRKWFRENVNIDNLNLYKY